MIQGQIPEVGRNEVGTALYSLEELISDCLLNHRWDFPEVHTAEEFRAIGQHLIGGENCRKLIWRAREILREGEVRNAVFKDCGYKEPVPQLALNNLLNLEDEHQLRYIELIHTTAVEGWRAEYGISSFEQWTEQPERAAVLVGELYQFFRDKHGHSTTAVYLLLSCLYTRHLRIARKSLREMVGVAPAPSRIPSLPFGTQREATRIG